MNQRLDDAKLAEVNRRFAEILVQGEFEQTEALSDEKDEPDLAELPRLVFAFNRRSLGTLRRLIDFLNLGE